MKTTQFSWIVSLSLLFAFGCSSSKQATESNNTPYTQTSKSFGNEPSLYERFTETTTYPDVVKLLGKPDAENTMADLTLPLKIVVYGEKNLCLGFLNKTPQKGRERDDLFVYMGTLRVHPSEILHVVKAEAGDTRPIMKFIQEQVDSLWASSEKEVRDKNPTQKSEVKDATSLREMMRSVDTKITYEHLMKNADKYMGQPWSFTGKILQIQESSGKTVALISSGPYGTKNIHVLADFTTDFIEGNQVYVIGNLNGDYSYTSQANYQLSVPEVIAESILKPNEAAKIKAGGK